MSSDLHLGGVYVPLITPFAADGSVALDELKRLANEYLDVGATGLLALGTTGEPATLSPAEKTSVIETVGEVCRNRDAQFLIGTGTNSTAASIEMIQATNKVAGLTAVMAVVPYYTRPSEAGIVAHFKALAAESNVPILIYNIPYRTGRGLGAASLLELAKTPNVAGVKQAVNGVDVDTMQLLAEKPDDFHVLCGDDPFIFSMMCMGATGAIAASSHLCTERFIDLVSYCAKGDHEHALAIAERLLPVVKTLFAEPNPAVQKGVLARYGRISTPDLRLPMTAASLAAVDAAFAAVEKAR